MAPAIVQLPELPVRPLRWLKRMFLFKTIVSDPRLGTVPAEILYSPRESYDLEVYCRQGVHA